MEEDNFKLRLINYIDLFNVKLNINSYRFVIIPNEEDALLKSFDDDPRFLSWAALYSADDSITYPWIILPKYTCIELSIDEVCKVLEKNNMIPLWIKVHIQDDNIVTLQVSKGMRKIEHVALFHKNAEYLPFSKNENPVIFDDNLRRKGIVKRLMWFFNLEREHRYVFKSNKLSNQDIKHYLDWHLNYYKYFPADYNNARIKGEKFPKYVIHLNESGTYRILLNPGKDNQVIDFETKDINSLVDYYIKNILAFEIDGIKIQK